MTEHREKAETVNTLFFLLSLSKGAIFFFTQKNKHIMGGREHIKSRRDCKMSRRNSSAQGLSITLWLKSRELTIDAWTTS